MGFQNKLETSAVAERLRKYAGVQGSLDEAIQKIVRRLVSDVSLQPTDLSGVMAKLEVDGPTEDPDLLFSGELRRKNGRLHIYHRPDLGRSRLRFTVAHELGHAILSTTGPRCPQQGDVVERVCDRLAAEILMPAFELIKKYPAKPSMDTVQDVSNRYEVSRSAAARRIAQLWNVAVLEVEQGKVNMRSARQKLSRYSSINPWSSAQISDIRKASRDFMRLVRQTTGDSCTSPLPFGVAARSSA